MNRHKTFALFLLSSMCLFLLIPAPAGAQDWGTILSARSKTSIRADRSMKAENKGVLKAGDQIKADFLKNEWYAVFSPEEKIRDEAKALGYVHSIHLTPPTATSKRTLSNAPKNVSYVRNDNADTVIVKNITFKKETGGLEKVLIEFNRFNTPRIFSIEGQKPRIVIDVDNVSSVKRGLFKINAGGRLVRQIRSSLDKTTGSMRIVIDVASNLSYDVNQTFYKAENIYTVDISEAMKKPADARPKKAAP
jgi:hypothetical protein